VVIAASAPSGLEQRNLFGEAERIAARAASASTRRQYSSIFRAFGDWLAGELGRPPVVGDLDTDARTRSTACEFRGTSRGRPRRSPIPTTPTCSVSLTAARSPASATTRYSGCSATADFAPPSSDTADLDPPARTLHSHHHPPSSPNMSTRTSGPLAGHPHTGTNLQEPPLVHVVDRHTMPAPPVRETLLSKRTSRRYEAGSRWRW